MNTEKRIELLRKSNADLYRKLEQAKNMFEQEKQKSDRIYKKEHELIDKLSAIYTDMQSIITNINGIRSEYEQNLNALKKCREIFCKGMVKVPFKIKLRTKFQKLKKRILRGK